MTFNQAYSDPSREAEPHALPDVEVFRLDAMEAKRVTGSNRAGAGFYYWYCLPGCLPDSDAIGPFDSEADALDDALDDARDE